MKDEELLQGLRNAAIESDARGTGTPLDEPLGPLFEARVAAEILRRQRVRKRSRLFAVVGPLSLAAAMALLVVARRAPVASPPLPAYTLLVEGGDDAVRGKPDSASSRNVVTHRGATLTFLLRPAEDVSDAPVVRTFVTTSDGEREVHIESRTAPSGAVELHAATDTLLGTAIEGDITFVVARAGTSVETDERHKSGDPSNAAFRIERLHVRITR